MAFPRNNNIVYNIYRVVFLRSLSENAFVFEQNYAHTVSMKSNYYLSENIISYYKLYNNNVKTKIIYLSQKSFFLS